MRLRSSGKVENFYANLGESIVAPGSNHLPPLPPEFIRPRTATKSRTAKSMPPSGGLSESARRWCGSGPSISATTCTAARPAREAVLEAGGSFLFTCKPKSHAALYEYIQGVEVDSLRTVEGRGGKKVHCFHRWISGVPTRDGEDALKVNWFEITVGSPSGGRRYHSAFATDLEVGRDTVEDLARCARARWKVKNNAFGILKDGFNLDHNFYRGRDALAGLPGDVQHNLSPDA